MAKNYDRKFRETCLNRIMPPKNESVRTVHREIGVPEGTLHRWKAEAKRAGWQAEQTSNPKQSKHWSSADKFNAIMDTAHLNQAEISEYCRRNGIYVEQLEDWRKACQEANGGTNDEVCELKKQVRSLRKQNEIDKKELARSQAALAETAALLVLRKKPRRFGGTTRTNDQCLRSPASCNTDQGSNSGWS